MERNERREEGKKAPDTGANGREGFSGAMEEIPVGSFAYPLTLSCVARDVFGPEKKEKGVHES